MNDSNEKISEVYDKMQDLGAGTFAEVRKSFNKKLQIYQALKVMQVSPLDSSQVFDQVKKLKQLQHDNIIKYYGYIYDQDNKEIYIQMELCKGNLRHLIQKYQKENKNYFTSSKIIQFIVQITSAFLLLNSYGVMHLDLKPQNILYVNQQYNYFKLCDFGCSQISQKSCIRLATYQFGTFNYLAPQIYFTINQKKQRRTSCDIWSLGIILYQLVYKQYPFPFSQKQQGTIDRQIIKKFINNQYSIQYNNKNQEFIQINNIIKMMLIADSTKRITWSELKFYLINQLNKKQFHFKCCQVTLDHHLHLCQLFFCVTWLIRENSIINIHQLWNNSNSLSYLRKMDEILIRLIYLLCLEFESIFCHKIIDNIPKQKLDKLAQYKVAAAVEENKQALKNKQKILKLNSIDSCKQKLIQISYNILSLNIIKQQQGSISVSGIKIFCKNVIQLQNTTKDIFDDYKTFQQSYKYFQVQQ